MRFVPAVFSHTHTHTGQIHGEFKAFVKEQTKQKLVLVAFGGEAKASKTRSVTKWRSKCISVVITKTASRNCRNVAFKVAKMRDAIIVEDQDEFLMRNAEHTDVGVEANNRAQLKDKGQNADLYIGHPTNNSYTSNIP